jgi:ankyrin repeat protein
MDLSKYVEYSNGSSESIEIAALTNDTRYIVQYYHKGGDLFVIDERKQSLLHLACRNKALLSAELLLKLGLHPNASDKYGETPLHIASYMGNEEMVKLLLEFDGNPNSKNFKMETPLHLAALKGIMNIVSILLDYNANIHAMTEFGTSVLQYAVKSKKRKVVRYLVEKGAIVQSSDHLKQSTLHYAALYSLPSIVEYLLEIGVNPYAKNKYLMTPLHHAVEHPQIEMVEAFLKSGCTSYDKSKFGQSPYDLAIQKNNYEAQELFNKLKNDKQYQMLLRKNELTFAIIRNNIDLALSLVDRVDVNKKDIFGNTPLFYAIVNEEVYLVAKLFEKGAFLEDIDHSHFDAIYYAILTANKDIISEVAKRGYNQTTKYFGYTIEEYLKWFDLQIE